MTLQRFLLAVGESRVAWLGRRAWRPAPAERFGPGMWMAQTAVTAVLGILPGLVLVGLLMFHPVLKGGWWPLRWAIVLAAVAGAVGYGLVAMAWNRRAAELERAGLTEPPPGVPTRWWQRWLVAPAYLLVGFLLTPVVLTVSVDNALGRWAWKRELSARTAREEPMTLEALRGPAPADADNFAMTPLIRAMWDYEVGVTGGLGDIVWKDPSNNARAKCVAVPTSFRPASERKRDALKDGRLNLDWVARSIRTAPMVRPEGLTDEQARRFGVVDKAPKRLEEEEVLALAIPDPAGEVLEYLRGREAELAEITAAAGRARSRFGIHFEDDMGVMLPYLGTLKSISLTYRIRAVARLAKGQTEGAFEDVRVAFRLAEVLNEDPVLIGYLVQIAQFSIATSAAWEGMVDHRWTEPQLVELQQRFAKADFRQTLIQALRGESLFGTKQYDLWLGAEGRSEPAVGVTDEAVQVGPVPTGMFPRLPFFAPRGVFRRNQIHHVRAFDRLVADVRDPEWPRTLEGLDGELMDDRAYSRRLGLVPRTPSNMLPSMLMPAMRKTQGKAARMMVIARLGEVACALERYRLRHGAYPESLDRLVPDYVADIPKDPMTAEALRYERTGDGWFTLWSVGLNGRDDGGIVHPTDNDRKGDWVWPTPVPRVGGLRLF